MNRKFLIFALFLLGRSLAAALPAEGVVKSVTVTGAESVSNEQVLAVVRLRTGDILKPMVVSEDIKSIWKMGLFSDVEARLDRGAQGLKVTYAVTERPTLKEIRFFGNKEVSDGDLKEKTDKIPLKEGDVYEARKIAEAVDKIGALYREKDFYAATVKSEIKRSSDKGKVILNFLISEGLRMKIRKISVTGNKVFTESTIKGEMADTKEVGWFNLGGSYDRAKLEADLKLVLQAYNREGYVKAKLDGYTLDEFPDHSREIAEKATQFDDEKKEIVISFHVDEGAQYKLENLDLAGNKLYTTEEIMQKIDSRPGQVFNQDKWEKDMARVRSFYAEKGYIWANPNPGFEYDDAAGRVKIHLNFTEGGISYIEAIKIRGNEVTKDRVIRRELIIKEGEAFDSAKIAKSRERVYNLGFFENVGVDLEPGSEMDKQVLVFDVSPERKTGTLSLGAGYSSAEGLVGYLQVSQNNLFGNGQSISAQWEAGSLKNSYSLSFTEPWLLDTPTSFGFDLFNMSQTQAYNNQGYDLHEIGGALRLGRILNQDWKSYLTYRYVSDDYENITAALAPYVPVGINNVSSITPGLTRDTRDNIFDASRGTYNNWSVMLAGGYLGGDANFYKPVWDSSVFFNTPAAFGWRWLNKFNLGIHGRVGQAIGFPARGDSTVPPSQRFFVGGTDTVRGYADRSLGASAAGGTFMLLNNTEYGFKPFDPLKLRVFYDSGNTWNDVTDVRWSEVFSDHNALFLYPAWGFGFLFTIPTSVIQIRLDIGFPLVDTDPQNEATDHNQRPFKIHFNIGNIF